MTDPNNITTKVETVDQLIEHLETKLDLLKQWKENHDASQELADGGCLDESDGFDDKCIEIEEHFEEEYGIKFDSFGDMYDG